MDADTEVGRNRNSGLQPGMTDHVAMTQLCTDDAADRIVKDANYATSFEPFAFCSTPHRQLWARYPKLNAAG